MKTHFKEDYKNKYKIIERIGLGNYTEVYKAINKNTNEVRAIKIIKLRDIKQELEEENSNEEVNKKLKEYINRLINEIKNMIICAENNINSVKYYESYETENEFAFVLELCNENLTKFKRDKNFNEDEIYEILNQLNNTFKIMKKNNIVHRDLKPDNILIKYEKDQKYTIKLCDYGISKTDNFTKLRTHAGTSYYMAPEIMQLTEENNYNYKCDLWSLGIIIYELFFKERPYKGISEYAILEEITKFGKHKIKKTNDELLDDLLNKLLEKDPKKRISWDEYFNHLFFKLKKNSITIIYKNNNDDNKIRIFGKEFVENNKNNCKIIYKSKEFLLKEYFEMQKKENILKINLFGIIILLI